MREISSSSFESALEALCRAHDVALTGHLRKHRLSDAALIAESFTVTESPVIDCYGGKDMTGPFLIADVMRKPETQTGDKGERAPQVMSDIHDYQSMATGERISSRSNHRTHLKQHGLIEVGNEKMPTERREVRGDFNCREELTRATRDVLDKHNIRR